MTDSKPLKADAIEDLAISKITGLQAELDAGGSNAIVNTDDDSARQFYVGAIDPSVSYTPSVNDVWVDPTKSTGAIRYWDGTEWAILSTAEPLAADIQVFLSAGVWTKPSGGYLNVVAHVMGAGGGGGGGNSSGSGAAGLGGGGGGAGGYVTKAYAIGDLSATESVAVGAAGVAGAASGVGGAGAVSTFSASTTLASASGGTGGAAGVNSGASVAGGAGGGGTGDTVTTGGTGGNGGTATDATVPTVGAAPGGGGGGGGHLVSGNIDGSGFEHHGADGGAGANAAAAGLGGVHDFPFVSYTNNVPPTAGADVDNSTGVYGQGGGGGGGMQARTTGSGFDVEDAIGADGGFPGGGGGGGGGERNSSDVGQAGGDGGAGYVVVIST